MAKFKCIASGNIIEVHNEYDISQFRLQTLDYVEIVEKEKEKEKKSKPKDK